MLWCHMTLPPLNALRTFEAVARLGSFRAAADVLCVTQSAVSHQIRNLEDWLNKPLFEREGNRTQLLPHGAELARNLAISLAEIEAACARTRNTSQALVIAAIPSVAMCWLIPRLSRFRAANPTIETRIVYAIHGQDINFHDVHLAFVFSRGAPTVPNVKSRFFLDGQSIPVCSPSLLQTLGRKPETDADILQLGLLHDGDASGWRNWLDGGDARDQKADIGPTFEDFNLLRAAALSGQGVALCPLAMVRSDLEAGSLVQVSDRIMPHGSDYFLLSATSANPQVVRQAQIFQDWAMAERGNEDDSPESARSAHNRQAAHSAASPYRNA
jgi:DNA-binding transcriptional LysR family regulator